MTEPIVPGCQHAGPFPIAPNGGRGPIASQVMVEEAVERDLQLEEAKHDAEMTGPSMRLSRESDMRSAGHRKGRQLGW